MVENDVERIIWYSVDPMTEKMPKESPYIYTGNNPINFIDVGGNFRLPAQLQGKYPHFEKYLNNSMEGYMKNPKVIAALQKNGNLSAEQIAYDSKGGQGTIINIKDLPGGRSGQLDRKNYNGDSQISIDLEMIQKFEHAMNDPKVEREAKKTALLQIVSTIIHEEAHVGTGGRLWEDSGEAGIKTEIDIYGSNINALDINHAYSDYKLLKDGVLYPQTNHGKIIENHPEKMDRSVLPQLTDDEGCY